MWAWTNSFIVYTRTTVPTSILTATQILKPQTNSGRPFWYFVAVCNSYNRACIR